MHEKRCVNKHLHVDVRCFYGRISIFQELKKIKCGQPSKLKIFSIMKMRNPRMRSPKCIRIIQMQQLQAAGVGK